MFTFSCTAYKDKESIPPRFTHHSVKGKNVSPGFAWSGGPVETKSFVLSIIDPHPVANNWIHWMVVDIPFNAREIPEAASNTERMPRGARELLNTYGEQGYGGPAPPKGSGPHPYIATLYALNIEKLPLPRESSLRQFQSAIAGKILDQVALTGYFERT